jgi:hypothetical protein
LRGIAKLYLCDEVKALRLVRLHNTIILYRKTGLTLRMKRGLRLVVGARWQRLALLPAGAALVALNRVAHSLGLPIKAAASERGRTFRHALATRARCGEARRWLGHVVLPHRNSGLAAQALVQAGLHQLFTLERSLDRRVAVYVCHARLPEQLIRTICSSL